MADVCKETTCCFVGRGEIYIGKYDACCGATDDPAVTNLDKYPLLPVGNAHNFEINETTTTITPPKDYRGYNSVSDCPEIVQVDKVEVKLTLTCQKAENLAKALSGDVNTVVGATGLSQTFKFTTAGQFIPFRNADGDSVANVDVASVTGLTGLVEGKDYKLTANGIQILETTTQTLPLTLAVTFSHGDYSEVERLTEVGGEYVIVLDGINIVDGKPTNQRLYRVRLNPGGLKNMMADGYMEWEMTGTALPDSCKTKANKSKYGTFALSA